MSSPSWTFYLLSPLGLMMIGGLFALVYGIRGRRTDDHPICRRCGFDLFGRPEGSEGCSECGADLHAATAMRIGHRRRRPMLALLGVLLILPMLFVVGENGWVRVAGVEHYTRN